MKRIERDAFGAIEVPAERLWGAQTQRSLEHFAISQERMPQALILALAEIKRAAAQINAELGPLDQPMRPRLPPPPRKCWPGGTGRNFRFLPGKPARALRPI